MASYIHMGSWVHTLSEKNSHSVTHPAVNFEVLAVYVFYACSRILHVGSSRNLLQDFHKLMFEVFGPCLSSSRFMSDQHDHFSAIILNRREYFFFLCASVVFDLAHISYIRQ
jgi:hypothetical protein